MKKIFASLAVAAVSVATFATADTFENNRSKSANNNSPGFYVGGGLGAVRAKGFKEVTGEYINTYAKGKLKGKPALHLYNFFAGYKFNEYFRADVNGQYRSFKYSTVEAEVVGTSTYEQKIKNYSLFLNGYIDAPTKTAFTPYVTAGLGYASNTPNALAYKYPTQSVLNFNAPGKKTGNLAWNVGVGSKIRIYKNWDLSAEYRYVDLGKVKAKTAVNGNKNTVPAASQKLKVHQGLLNVIYNL